MKILSVLYEAGTHCDMKPENRSKLKIPWPESAGEHRPSDRPLVGEVSANVCV
jgi:hypothetical protein